MYIKKITAVMLLVALCFDAFALTAHAQSIDGSTSEEIKKLNEQINSKNNDIKSLDAKADAYAKLIEQKQRQKESLDNELSLIENRIKKTEINIERKGKEIEAANLIIRETTLMIGVKEQQIEIQRVQLASLLREINRQDQRGQLEVLMANDNISKFFSYLKHLEDVQSNVRVTLSSVKAAKRDLEVYQFGLEQDKAELQTLALELEIEKQKLDEEKKGKVQLINETEASEEEYQRRLSEIRSQQRVANDEVAQLQDSIKEKLHQAQLKNPSFVLNPNSLLWPVPRQGIVTYFHDPTYPYRHIVGEHSGLDMRTLINGFPSMGLPVKASASGVVVKVIRNGRFTGNAVFISHGDLMTVYLHLSVIYVNTDDFVEVGKIFARSGGAPGDPGAGLSSGPHLHYEVRKNGIPIDPCQYLVPNC
ncbi:MAG: peptidoglycan DD-metalloendopeptidase family protein [Parcubacteria group bacterium]|nr:peptidoglycan DD-metalloendopeptidase family protein [Parcubacteria group bacterium]